MEEKKTKCSGIWEKGKRQERGGKIKKNYKYKTNRYMASTIDLYRKQRPLN